MSVTETAPVVAPSATDALASRPDRPEYGVRRFDGVNWLGVWTLYKKEVRRFLKVAFQTVLAPVISTLLFLLVFVAAWGDRPPINVEGTLVPFLAFLPPGLIMMAVLNNAFANSSSSLIIGKVQGNIVDVLMPPLSASELTAAFVLGAATRGLMVGAVTAVTCYLFVGGSVPLTIASPAALLFFAVAASLMLAMAGVLAGVWAEKFDQLAAVTNFLVTPLAMLSGTFFSVKADNIPDFVATISHFNPFFYAIDGFRYGVIGASDAPVLLGAAVMIGVNAALYFVCYLVLKSGWRLKS